MSLAPMTKIAILTPKSSQDKLLSLLQALEAVEISSLDDADLTALEGNVSADLSQRIEMLDSDLKKIAGTIKILRQKFRPKQSIIDQFASLRTPISEGVYSKVVEDSKDYLSLCAQVQDLEYRWAELQKARVDFNQELNALEPWMQLDIQLDQVGETNTCQVKIGTLEPKYFSGLQSELDSSELSVHTEVVAENPQAAYLFLIYDKREAPLVSAILSKYGFNEARLPRDKAGVEEVYQKGTNELNTIAQQSEELLTLMAKANESVAKVMSLSDYFRSELSKAMAAKKFGDTGHVVVLNGWCRQDRFDEIKRNVEETIPVAVVEGREPLPDEVPPVDFDNPSLIKPYETITTTAGVPRRGSPDPTPGLAPFFFAFFGIALGDAGYGIVLTIMALWLMKRTRAVGDGRQFLKVLTMGGISTIIFGVLTGSWFGNLIPIPPIWFNPVNDPIRMLIVALGFGLIHLFVGLGVMFMHNLRNGQVLDALFDQALWWVFISGLALMLIGAGEFAKYLSIAGAIGLVLTQGRKEKSILKKVFKGISSLTGVSGYLSDVLSYSRLLALGLATSVIGVVINDVSKMVGDIPVLGIVLVTAILIGGHLFNLLINVVSAYVHTSRLQYVEYFSKCFESGGRLFRPFALRTKMVQIVPDEEQQLNLDIKGGASQWKLHGGQH